MNNERLHLVEMQFMSEFPGGFDNPVLVKEGKKHQVGRRQQQASDWFSEDAFATPQVVAEHMLKITTQSSLVSRFEKPALKRLVDNMTWSEKEQYAFSLFEMLHGDQAQGFETMVALLRPHKLAKWPILTVIPYYFAPSSEIFVKPTTVKKIIAQYELDDLEYRPLPDYGFYQAFKGHIDRMKSEVAPSLAGDNAAFTWFLSRLVKV